MRATKDHVLICDVPLSATNQRAFEAYALKRGISVPEAIAECAIFAVDSGVDLPEKEGQILPFEALKSAVRGTKA